MESLERSCPNTSTVPRSGMSRPSMSLRMTDLPEPDSPMTTVVFPVWTSMLRPLMTSLSPKDL